MALQVTYLFCLAVINYCNLEISSTHASAMQWEKNVFAIGYSKVHYLGSSMLVKNINYVESYLLKLIFRFLLYIYYFSITSIKSYNFDLSDH